MINYRSVNDMSQTIKKHLHKIPDVDYIVGIPRSGMLPASMIALYLGKPLISLDQVGQPYFNNCTNRIKLDCSKPITKCLVVDDSCSSGHSITIIKNQLFNRFMDVQFIYAAVYVLESSKKYVDLWFEVVEHLRLFEWNIMDHSVLLNSCMDLDGVLCVDPTLEENDDGIKYLNFLRNAKPKFIPQHEIKAIVTCRLEKYRAETESWLKQHNIKYEKLYMMNYPDATTRIRANKYCEYKAEIYNQTKTILFYESNVDQAERIYLMTGKPVYCVGNNHFYGGIK